MYRYFQRRCHDPRPSEISQLAVVTRTKVACQKCAARVWSTLVNSRFISLQEINRTHPVVTAHHHGPNVGCTWTRLKLTLFAEDNTFLLGVSDGRERRRQPERSTPDPSLNVPGVNFCPPRVQLLMSSPWIHGDRNQHAYFAASCHPALYEFK